MSDQPKKCIFCGSVGKLTTEHIWGEWVQKYVPRTKNKHDMKVIVGKSPTERVHGPLKIKAGDPLNSKVKEVCAACNNGWMSQIQEQAKPYLIPLFEGRDSVLGSVAQAKIAAWITMSTMTGEYLTGDIKNVAVPQSERTWFMKKKKPPRNWRIWIGKYERQKWVGHWMHNTFPIFSEKDVPEATVGRLGGPNHQTTTFVVGKLYVHVFSGLFRNIVMEWDWRTAPKARTALTQIWPPEYPAVFWPVTVMNDGDATAFAIAFIRHSERIALKGGWHAFPSA